MESQNASTVCPVTPRLLPAWMNVTDASNELICRRCCDIGACEQRRKSLFVSLIAKNAAWSSGGVEDISTRVDVRAAIEQSANLLWRRQSSHHHRSWPARQSLRHPSKSRTSLVVGQWPHISKRARVVLSQFLNCAVGRIPRRPGRFPHASDSSCRSPGQRSGFSALKKRLDDVREARVRLY